MQVEENRVRYDLEIYKGATYRKTAWFKQNKQPIDLTGYSAKAQIRPSLNSETLTVELTVEIDLEEGAITMGIEPEITATLPQSIQEWDLQVIDPDGIVYYYIYGKVYIIGRVTV